MRMCDFNKSDWQRYRREQSGAYLRRIRDMRRHIAALNAEVDEHRALASGLTGIDYSRDMVQVSPTDDAMPNAVAKLLDIIAERVELAREYTGMLDECGAALRDLNGTYADILRYRYLCDYSWERIAASANYSEAYLYELHNQALSAFWEHMPETQRDPLPRAL